MITLEETRRRMIINEDISQIRDSVAGAIKRLHAGHQYSQHTEDIAHLIRLGNDAQAAQRMHSLSETDPNLLKTIAKAIVEHEGHMGGTNHVAMVNLVSTALKNLPPAEGRAIDLHKLVEPPAVKEEPPAPVKTVAKAPVPEPVKEEIEETPIETPKYKELVPKTLAHQAYVRDEIKTLTEEMLKDGLTLSHIKAFFDTLIGIPAPSVMESYAKMITRQYAHDREIRNDQFDKTPITEQVINYVAPYISLSKAQSLPEIYRDIYKK